jgi:four helix bundle protein
MAIIRRFEDIVAWQKARELCKMTYVATRQGMIVRDFALVDQMRRAAISIISNIAEGFERSRPAEFHQFLSIAKASCAELRSQFYLALDVEYFTQQEFNDLFDKSMEVARLIGALRAAVAKRCRN